MTIRFSVNYSTLRAALTHAAQADVRFYLNGVHFDLTSGHVVATDGHRLFAAQLGRGDWTRGPAFTVPRADVELALKGANRYLTQCAVTVDEKGDHVTLGNLSTRAIDGRFPEWRRVIPTGSASGAWTPVDPDYVRDAMIALDLASGGSGKRPKKGPPTLYCADVHYNGEGNPIVVTREGVGALVVVMPMRTDMPTERGVKVAAVLASTPCAEAEPEAAEAADIAGEPVAA